MDGTTYPGDEAVATRSRDTCLPEFESFIGVSAEEAGTLGFATFHPSEESWTLGDREILCFVYDTAAQTAYSLKDAGTRLLEVPEAEAEAPTP